jgi:choloylglycine hydrolase
MKRFFLTLLLVTTAIELLYPCSAFVLKKNGQFILAKNFDWTFRDGMLIKNLRHIQKTAYCTHTGRPANWTSKYGSVTFNQNGKNMPYGGMNEKGLVVEMLWLDLTKFNIDEEKDYVNELEWIQYQLDNYESVGEVLDHLNDLKIYPLKGKIHYILTDGTGESVIIEYLNGKPFTSKKEVNSCQAITNNAVIHSEKYKDELHGIPEKNHISFYRYHQLEQRIASIENLAAIDEQLAFNMLKQVTISKGDFKTMWSIVYNINTKSVSFFTDSHQQIKTIRLAALDFDKDADYFNLNQNMAANIDSALTTLTAAKNEAMVSASLIHLGLDEAVTKDISQHQFDPQQATSSVFSENYFHFQITVPLENDTQQGFFAVMDSEENFKKRKAVPGSYLYGTISKGPFIIHIYGLKNGRYSMLSFLDDNKNKHLDFDGQGKALEKYAIFGNNDQLAKQDFNFTNTSENFTRNNAKVLIKWREY